MCNLGRSIDAIEIAPSVGYFVVQNKVLLGLSTYLSFYKYENEMDDYQYSSRAVYVGPGIFVRYYVFGGKANFLNNLFLHAELERLYVFDEYEDSSAYDYKNENFYDNVLAGVGYRQNLGGRFSLNFQFLVLLNKTDESPYSNPIFRMGIEF
jgi:hypothetical protein